jgi:hypothetical protein
VLVEKEKKKNNALFGLRKTGGYNLSKKKVWIGLLKLANCPMFI